MGQLDPVHPEHLLGRSDQLLLMLLLSGQLGRLGLLHQWGQSHPGYPVHLGYPVRPERQWDQVHLSGQLVLYHRLGQLPLLVLLLRSGLLQLTLHLLGLLGLLVQEHLSGQLHPESLSHQLGQLRQLHLDYPEHLSGQWVQLQLMLLQLGQLVL